MSSRVPRYPEVRIRLRSGNPFALVSAVRLGLRRSGVPPTEIHLFTEQALTEVEPERVRAVCSEWASLESGPR